MYTHVWDNVAYAQTRTADPAPAFSMPAYELFYQKGLSLVGVPTHKRHSKLDPATLAKHLGNPEGDIGKAVEIGFGNGREIPRLLSLSADVTCFGVNISDTMVADAAAGEQSIGRDFHE